MSLVITYCKETGRIYCLTSPSRWIDIAIDSADCFPTPTLVKEFDDPLEENFEVTEWFVDLKGPSLQLKAEFPSLTVNGGRISGVPDNTFVTWPDDVITTESQEFEFSSNVSDTFTFGLDAVPYLPYVLKVEYHD